MGVTGRQVGRQKRGALALGDGEGSTMEERRLVGEQDSQARPTSQRQQGRGPINRGDSPGAQGGCN